MAKVNVNVMVESEMKQKLEYVAKTESVSYADWVRYILFNAVKDFEKENGRIILAKVIPKTIFLENGGVLLDEADQLLDSELSETYLPSSFEKLDDK